MSKVQNPWKENIKRIIQLWKELLFECDLFEIYKFICKLLRIYIVVFFKYGLIDNTIQLEASSLCQLKCPTCCQTSGEIEKIIGKGYLKFKDFKKFVDNYPYFKKIELSNFGEIFLNPELNDIIKYAYEKNISLTAYNGVNLNTISDMTIEYLVKYQFKVISVSIDGATSKTYKIYRRGGDFNKVLENIKKINYCKQKYHAEFPKLYWQFIIFDHNKHELPLAGKMAKELNMQFMTISDWALIGYEREISKVPLLVCSQLWLSPQINWDGKLLGCCVNKWGDFGNVFESNLKRCLKSKEYIYTRKMLLGKKETRKDLPCFQCHYYQKIRLLKNHLNLYTKVAPFKRLVSALRKNR